MDPIIAFFRQHDWLANALGILVPLTGGLLFIYKVIRPWRQKSTIDSLLPNSFSDSWSADKAKSIARIAIVDDHLQDFPVQELKGDGYQVQTYKQVLLANIGVLAAYDIVFLDMKGIVKDDPEYGGLKLIAELRKISPQQKICAVSGQTFDPTATEFFKLADDYKKKPLTAHECRTVIESFLSEAFDPETLVSNARKALAPMTRGVRVKVISGIRSQIERPVDAQVLTESLTKLGVKKGDQHYFLTLARMLAREAK